MKATPRIIQQEFIGLNAEVVKSSNPSCVGISGKVVDETRNTFTVIHQNREKTVVKNTTVFQFTMPDGTVVEIDGKVIVGRPEDRIKKQFRRLW